MGRVSLESVLFWVVYRRMALAQIDVFFFLRKLSVALLSNCSRQNLSESGQVIFSFKQQEAFIIGGHKSCLCANVD